MFVNFGISSSAAEVDGFFSADMKVEAFSRTDGVDTDITSKITVGADTYDGVNSTRYTVPLTTGTDARFITSYQAENLNSTHEYNLNFKVQSSVPSSTSFFCFLYFYGPSGELIDIQTLAVLSGNNFKSGWNDVNINFVPNTSNITSGYTNEIVFQFLTQSNLLHYCRISNFIELTDNNSSDSLLRDILYAISTLDTNIDSYFLRYENSLFQKLNTLDSHIDTYFDELGGALTSAITTLDVHIDGYFNILLNGIIENDNALSDKLHEYLDKFKPRFYEVFNWRYGWISNDGVEYFEEDTGQAVISQGFFVPNGSKYIFDVDYSDYLDDGDLDSFLVDIVYFSNGVAYYFCTEYLSNFISIYPDGIDLPSGYTYYFSLTSYSDFTSLIGDIPLSDFCNSIVRVYADEGWLTAFRNSIVQGFYDVMNPGVYEEPTSNAWEDNKDKFEQIESELPEFDSSILDNVDISDYSGAFGAVRYLFERFLNASSLTTLLVFSLTFGLGVFLIGRKVGG